MQNVLAPGFTSLALHQDTTDITPRFARRIAMYAENASSVMREAGGRRLGPLSCDDLHDLFCQIRVCEQTINERCDDFLPGNACET